MSELSRKEHLKLGDEGYNVWVVSTQISGALYLNNDVCMVVIHHLRLMSGIGDQMRKKLAKEEIRTVLDVVTKMNDGKVKEIMKESKLRLPLLLELVRVCSSDIQTNVPKVERPHST